MHTDIKRFSFEGQIADDSSFHRLREQYEKMLDDEMRADGYIPVLGMGPYFSTEFVPSKSKKNRGNYRFIVTLYGTFVGKRKACRLQGIDVENGRTYPKSTPARK